MCRRDEVRQRPAGGHRAAQGHTVLGRGRPPVHSLRFGKSRGNAPQRPTNSTWRATVKEAYERRQLWGYLTEFAEERCAGHAVLRASAVQRDQHGTRARLKSGAHVSRQCVGSGAGLQSKLERPRGLVKLGGPLPGERFGDQAAERVVSPVAITVCVGR